MAKLSIARVDAMAKDELVAAFGDVAEQAPWVAQAAAARRPFGAREAMIVAFARAVAQASVDLQLALLCAHPDLAGKAALAGTLTADSGAEQARAGLDRLTPEELARFSALNARYRERFGFPFIFAVKGATKGGILAAFEARLANDIETERAAALAQVSRIMRYRLEDRVEG